MTSTLRFVALGLALLMGTVGCDSSQGKWEAFVYPRSDRGRAIYVGKFKTLVDCRAAALRALREHRPGDYECGLNCRIRKRAQRVLAHRALSPVPVEEWRKITAIRLAR